jgi:hypothetical protein
MKHRQLEPGDFVGIGATLRVGHSPALSTGTVVRIRCFSQHQRNLNFRSGTEVSKYAWFSGKGQISRT